MLSSSRKVALTFLILIASVIASSMVFATPETFQLAARSLGVRDAKGFQSRFGARPETCALAWNLMDIGDDSGYILEEGAHVMPVHLLWTSMFLKTYAKESVLADTAGVSRPTFRKYNYIVLSNLAGLRHNVIKLSNRFRRDRGRTCKMTVDCTDCRIQEPRRPWSRSWFTPKFKGPGLRYEVGVCIQTGDIVWINGPFKCGVWNDLSIFGRNLKHLLMPGEMVECDGGYRGDPACRHKYRVFSWSDLWAKADARARHECVNGDLKEFDCLCVPWRHPLRLHSLAFASCAVLTQLGYNLNGGGPFPVRY